MSTEMIVSYDGTSNDDDALALGKLLADAGATLALAYVRHSREFDPRREELAQHDAQRRLEQGAAWLGDPEIPRHVVVSASTGEGLAAARRKRGSVADRVRLRLPHAAGPRRARDLGPASARGRAGRGRRRARGPADRDECGDQDDRAWPAPMATTRRSAPPRRWRSGLGAHGRRRRRWRRSI